MGRPGEALVLAAAAVVAVVVVVFAFEVVVVLVVVARRRCCWRRLETHTKDGMEDRWAFMDRQQRAREAD